MYECKNKSAISWWKLADDQLWEQADSHKNKDGKLWVIGQIGFEMCVFNFDVTNYHNRGEFEHFSPLNLNNWSLNDLDYLNIDCIDRTINNQDTILVIKWRLDEPEHHKYIHDMFNYIRRNNP